jgi:polyisoprenoid-binding protein YceI
MKITPLLSISCAVLVAAHAAPAAAEPATYAIDASHTKVYWETRHFGTSTHRGRFDRVDGNIQLDRNSGLGEVSISIDTASVSSGVPALDTVLRGGNFLASDAHPTAYFVSRGLHVERGQVQELRGEFTLRGVSRPLSLQATNFACRDDARLKREVCGGDFETEIRRSDFGSTFGLPFVGDKVHLLIAVEGIRQ